MNKHTHHILFAFVLTGVLTILATLAQAKGTKENPVAGATDNQMGITQSPCGVKLTQAYMAFNEAVDTAVKEHQDKKISDRWFALVAGGIQAMNKVLLSQRNENKVVPLDKLIRVLYAVEGFLLNQLDPKAMDPQGRTAGAILVALKYLHAADATCAEEINGSVDDEEVEKNLKHQGSVKL